MLVELKRTSIENDGAFGELFVAGKYISLSLERTFEPGNKIVIPVGDHPIHRDWYHRGNYEVFEIDVQGSGIAPGRVHDRVLIHSANYEDQLRGCVAPGTSIITMKGKKAIGASKPALAKFMMAMVGVDEGTLRVTNP